MKKNDGDDDRGRLVQKTSGVISNPYSFLAPAKPGSAEPPVSLDTTTTATAESQARSKVVIPQGSLLEAGIKQRDRQRQRERRDSTSAPDPLQATSEKAEERRKQLSDESALRFGVNLSQEPSPLYKFLSRNSAEVPLRQRAQREGSQYPPTIDPLAELTNLHYEERRQSQPTGTASPFPIRNNPRPQVLENRFPHSQRLLTRYLSFRKALVNTNTETLVKYHNPIVQSLKDLSIVSKTWVLPDSEGLQLFLQDTGRIIPFLSPVQLGNVAWALGSLAGNTEVSLQFLFELTISSCTPTLLSGASDRDLAKLVWMFSKLGVQNADLYDRIAAIVVDKMDTFSFHNIALIAWGYAKAKIPADALFDAIKNQVPLTAGSHRGREFACLASAFETRVPRDRDFFDKLTGALVSELASFNGKSLANVMGSYSIAGIFPPSIFSAAFKLVTSRYSIQNIEVRDCVKLAIVFANCKLPCSEATRALTELVAQNLLLLSPGDLSLLMWALASNEYYRDTGFAARALETAVFSSLDNYTKANFVTILYSLVRQRHDPLPEIILNKILDPSFLPTAAKGHQLMTAWMLSVLRSDLRQLLPLKGRRRLTPEELAETMLGPMRDIASEEKGRLFIIRFGNILRDFSASLGTPASLASYSPQELTCLAASLSMSAQNRDAFLSLWVPTVLDRLAFGDPLFTESLLLLLSSYVFYGSKDGAHLGRIISKLSTVYENFHGRNLAHLAGLVNLLDLNLPLVLERARAEQSSIDPSLHRLLGLIPMQYSTLSPPKELMLVHKQLLSDVVGTLLQPAVRDMFGTESSQDEE